MKGVTMSDNNPVKLKNSEIGKLILDLNGWVLSTDYKNISKTFIFNDFLEAFSWMSSISLIAEKFNHHPEWKNVYNKVDVLLSTHDAQGLTKKDFSLAELMDKEFKK
jgi:4a-hydroxytetrahydrobiopterin dehydratase